ncbi:Cupin domain protein [Caulifigura coniformis]|uniref:Cupin domain protein n=1 Tax=Caulifigura coniformis TaxID=2527983 RepID=A0A517SBC9_9PLAN|nr:cupin domain-containing protein [Caulifigura coniformis]QDT53440.1 Cupin domain protein [Caulifigura coniformis]
MQRDQLTFRNGFRLSIANQRSQAAVMVIPPGSSEGGPDNDHRASDQWLYVVEGTGAAIVNGHRYPLKPGAIILIERGDRHELKATGRSPLKTVNLYVPPAFEDKDTPRPAGMSSQRP